MGSVLVVDDNAENRALAQATLEDEGLDVRSATSGLDAIAEFTRAPIDCILLDIRMPGLDGIATCARIRALPGGERVAIVFVTAERDVDTFDRAIQVGGDDFITKPFRTSELVVRIQTALRLRRFAAERGALAAELKAQRDELQRLQLQKEQLAAFLVHDLKNPVNAIELQAQRILRHAGASERAHDAARIIHDETLALMRLITNLLDIERADAGRLVPAREPRELAALVDAAVDELRARGASAGITVVGTAAPGTARVDADLVHRVLANLIDNAIRHAPEGSEIRVSGERSATGCVLRVADAGPGVPVEQRASVFERFVSGSAARDRTNRGLGLAFCKMMVESHGGRIWIEDAAPGAVFCIELPD